MSHVFMPRSTVVKASNGQKNTATLFLFHGSGGSGEDFKQWLDILNRRELTFPEIKIIYLTAPIQPYTPNEGMLSNVWFNRHAISIDVPEIKHSIDIMCNKVSEMIHREVSGGIPMNRIVIGGFSMGGCLAMHLAYRFKTNLAGCVAMSSFLNNNSLVYESLKTANTNNLPELLQFHGTSDTVVPLQWGKKTFESLKALGVSGEFFPLPMAEHEIVESEISYFKNWLIRLLPEKKV